ncbi:aminoglycoside phosphotransferase family protein [Nocardia neocaledoniensis]|uniref:Streptomycin 6-kinase n=1 Tax=Nocardia neocaledoniensis TaxID=236511 RepID=A0A317NUM3_9NOCA|nr:aminoglycoside phosphotransferase family protein [Nocardia neocaledoniensis]PWV78981.1 streptomycin 6-kinase [Nocardia neocaledoniensis]
MTLGRMPVVLPAEVEDTVREVFGEPGARWIEALPGVVAELARRWELTEFSAPFSGGTHAYVVAVRRADGSWAVLKVPMVDEENLAEASALHCYGGDGAVRLLDFDPDSGALLLEWARPGTELLTQPGFPSLEGRPENRDKVALACALYRRLRRPVVALPPKFPAFPLATDLPAGLRERLGEPNHELAQLLSTPLRDLVEHWCGELAEPDGPPLIVNRDTHLGNIVAAEREPWLLIDPKPCLGEAAFDAGFLLMIQVQSDPTREHADAVVPITAAALGVDPVRARGWALVRAVEEMTWAIEDEDPEMLALHTAVAYALADLPFADRPQ